MKEGKIRNLRMTIEYDGTDYHGWQIQKGDLTVQELVEKAIQRIIGEKVKVTGCGRTDQGVHARDYVANFKTGKIISEWNLMLALNSKLPKDVRIKHIEEVPEDFHARYSAKSKIYQYRVYNAPVYSPLLCRFAYHYYRNPLVVAYMQEGANYLVGEHDFFSLATFSKEMENTVRTIYSLKVLRDERHPDLILINVEGNGFLYNMVRTIAGTLIDIGAGLRKPSLCKKLVETRDRTQAGANLPPEGLILLTVNYE